MTVRTVSEILEEIKLDTIAENPSLCDWSLNSMNRKRAIPIAMQIQKLEQRIEDAANAQMVQTATGKDLDELVKDRGLTRLEGAQAIGQVSFVRTTPASADISIPSGTEVAAQDTDGAGPVYFSTVQAVTLLAGNTSVDAIVEADKIGTRGNVRAAAVSTITGGLAGVDYVTNPLPFTGGTDTESDADLRQRYILLTTKYGRATVPTMKEWLEALDVDGTKIVREAKVHNKGMGDAEVIVDASPTAINIAVIEQGIEDCISAGVSARGMLAGHIEAGANAGNLGDTAGGKLWVRPLVNVTALDSFTFDYVTDASVTHTATVSVPAGTVAGSYIECTLEAEDDEVVSVPDPTYAGSFEYDILIGYGDPPNMFLVPEKVNIDVAISYVANATPESDLSDLIQASIEAFLDDFMIGEELQFSDLYDAARMQYLGDGLWGDRFYGIDEITVLTATDGTSTIDALGEKIIIDTDARIDPGTVVVTLVV